MIYAGLPDKPHGQIGLLVGFNMVFEVQRSIAMLCTLAILPLPLFSAGQAAPMPNDRKYDIVLV